MELHGRSFIGARLGPETTQTFKAVSPLDAQALAPFFYKVGPSEVNAALELAHGAFQVYGRADAKTRAGFLDQIADEIAGLGEELIARAHEETGLPETRLIAERGRTCNQLKMFAELAREGSWVDARIDTAQPDRKPLPRPDVRRLLVPVGPVVVFGSSNFPLAFSVAGGDTASALATGNPVVVKAHSGHPGTSEMIAGAVRRAADVKGLPEGVFSMLHGSGREIGMALVRHPATKAVGFTGSRAAGRALFDAAASRPEPIPVFAEMSSLNPLFVLPHALNSNRQKIAEGLAGSITLGVGQFCTKPGLVFAVSGPDLDSFAEHLAKAIQAVAPATMLHSGICEAYQKGIGRTKAMKGVSVLGKSSKSADPAQTHAEALVIRTDGATFRSNPHLSEEVFGPFAVLIALESVSEMEQVARNLEGQLTASLHGSAEDLKHTGVLLSILQQKAGRLVLNGFPTGVEVCPAMHHGGPYPATTDVRFTSVGTAALYRFVRPICFQNCPQSLLPDELKDANPLRIARVVNGKLEAPGLV